jgi:hypothetical protein
VTPGRGCFPARRNSDDGGPRTRLRRHSLNTSNSPTPTFLGGRVASDNLEGRLYIFQESPPRPFSPDSNKGINAFSNTHPILWWDCHCNSSDATRAKRDAILKLVNCCWRQIRSYVQVEIGSSDGRHHFVWHGPQPFSPCGSAIGSGRELFQPTSKLGRESILALWRRISLHGKQLTLAPRGMSLHLTA